MLLPVPESMYPWVMMIFMALLLAPAEFASPCSHSGRYHRVALQTQHGPADASAYQHAASLRSAALSTSASQLFAEMLTSRRRRRADMLKAEPARAQRAEIGCSMRVYDSSYSRGGPHVYTLKDRAGARGRSRSPRVQLAQRPGGPAQVEHEDSKGTCRGRLLQVGRRGRRRVLQGACREGG